MYGEDIAKSIMLRGFKDRKVLVYYDADVDGLFAGYIASKFCEKQGVPYQIYINDNRGHGFRIAPEKLKGYLVIAVDFDIPTDIVEQLVLNDVSLVSFDHHKIQDNFVWYKYEGAEACILNNQYPFEPSEDRYLSGAGVVYEALTHIDPTFSSQELQALVGITLLSDSREIENRKAREYLTKTFYTDTEQGYLHYLMTEVLKGKVSYGFGTPRFDRNFIDFTFSPTLNAMLRYDKGMQAVNFICGRGLDDCKAREVQKEVIEKMTANAYRLKLSAMTVVACDESILDGSGVSMANYIGYLANKEKGMGVSVLAYTYRGQEVTRASFRGRYSDVDYNDAFNRMGIVSQGHKSAFGILDFQPTQDIWEKLNHIVGLLDSGHVQTFKVVDVHNLSTAVVQFVGKLAEENMYVRDEYRTYLRYQGTTYRTARKSTKYIEYIVDGLQVKGFDTEINPCNGLILPVMEKNHVKLYLRPNIT